jgi:hypothetical protein
MESGIVLLDLSWQRALACIGPTRVTLEDRLVPAAFPPAPNSPYRAGYDWLYIYERRLARRLASWFESRRHDLIGSQGLLSEALSNAFCHGNKRDPQQPIWVSVLTGSKGCLIQIKDAGDGFDVPQTLAHYKAGKAYYSVAGNGLKRMAETQAFGVFFNRSGNALHLLYLFGGLLPILQASPHRHELPREQGAPAPHASKHLVARLGRRPAEVKPHAADMPDTALWAPWVKAAVARTKGQATRRLALGEELAEAFADLGDHLLRLADILTDRLAAGPSEMVHILTPKAAILLYRESGAEVAAWLDKNTHPKMARKILSIQLLGTRSAQPARRE